MLSEDEIIDKINYMINNWHRNVVEIDIQWIQGLLDLYKQEKEKNKVIAEALVEWINGERIYFNHISKDTIKQKIKELEDECDNSNAYDTTWYEASINTLKELLEE